MHTTLNKYNEVLIPRALFHKTGRNMRPQISRIVRAQLKIEVFYKKRSTVKTKVIRGVGGWASGLKK